ncbi:MAG TPA: electron transport complex subunit G, partial [Pseudomonas sp.]|nr:electron transport complex subunit G [Pseudomonas sp.]
MIVPEISRSMLKNATVLGLFAIVTVGAVTLLQQGTAERIQAAERAAQVRALGEILPTGSYDNHLLDDSVLVQDRLLGNRSPLPAYIAIKDGRPSAVILQAIAPDGYSGAIHLLVGIHADGRVAGVRVIGHRETPGLGDKIELAKSPWIRSFDGKSLTNPA